MSLPPDLAAMAEKHEEATRRLWCCYDNPATYQRELWVAGRLVAAVSFRVFCLPPNQRPMVHMGINTLGEWREGQHAGDLAALPPSRSARYAIASHP